MIGWAVLFECGRKGRDLGEDNGAEQKQNEGSAPLETHRSCP
jgi:hypothetical protein